MTYKFKYTERNVPKATEFETRALLFLIGLSSKKDFVNFVFIDCFNDLSGTGEKLDELYDIQSKGVKNLTPKKIGQSLVTLYENYLSKLKFSHFILFTPTINENYLKDPSLKSFQMSNFGKQDSKIREGLEEEYLRRNPEFKSESIQSSIGKFLGAIEFVVDNNSKSEYIRFLTSFKQKNLKSDEFYESVFEDIRAIQLAKKTVLVEAFEILMIKEALNLRKHIDLKDIRTLLVNRLVGIDVFKDSKVPVSFLEYIQGMETEQVKDLILECNSHLSKALFDKNSKREFWVFLESAISTVFENPLSSPAEIYSLIDADGKVRSRYMKDMAGLFLISLVKDGFSK
jgi:hypothetical protein